MIDIHFYMKFGEMKQKMLKEKIDISQQELFDALEEMRSQLPVVYNIETTNLCNMHCVMCPGPTKMTRPRVTMPMEVFEKIITQIEPFSSIELYKWEKFVEKYYNIHKNDMSENHFFTYIIPKVIVLHGYGEPLLDPLIVERVKRCTDLDIPSYFSCNPWNLKDINMGMKLFEAGLNYIKFHTDAADDFSIKQIRGKQADFSGSYKKILDLLKIKKENDYKTTVVVTMLDLNKSNQQEEFEKLKKKFEGEDVYIYLKSQDQLWFDQTGAKTKAIHWLEPCQFPWSSMTIKSNGECAQCVEDYNNEIILGDAKEQSLIEIWNSNKYYEFRWLHILMDKKVKCTQECDMKLVGEYIKNKT